MTRQPMPPGLPGQRDGPLSNRVMESFYDFFSGLYPGSFTANGAAFPGANVGNNSFFNPTAQEQGAKEVENMPPVRRNQSQERGAFNKHGQAYSPTASPTGRSPPTASRGMGEPLRGQSVGRPSRPQPSRQDEWYGEPPPGRDYSRGRDPRQGPEFDRSYPPNGHEQPGRYGAPPPGYGQDHAGGQDYRDFAGQDYAGRGDYRGDNFNNRDYPGANEYGSYPGRNEYGPSRQDYGHEQPGAMQEGWQDYSCPSFPVPPYGGAPGYPQDAAGMPPDYGPTRELPQPPPSHRTDSRECGRGHEMRQGSLGRPPMSPSGDRRPPVASASDRRSQLSPARERHAATSSSAPGDARPGDYPVEKEDLLDQHVHYYLRKHPEARKKHTVIRKAMGVYELDGREVAIEWQYASEPGQQGCLVVVDGPLRQPFADYMEETEANAQYEGQDIGQSNLHCISKDRRISFNDQHKVYSRLEAMKVAKEQALAREKAAGFVKEGKEVPQEILTKYKKSIQQKLGLPRRPASPQRSKRAPEGHMEREPQEHMLEPQRGAPQHGMPQQGGSPQAAMSPQGHGMSAHGMPPQGGAPPPQCVSPHGRCSPQASAHQQGPPQGFGMPPGSPHQASAQQQQQQHHAAAPHQDRAVSKELPHQGTPQHQSRSLPQPPQQQQQQQHNAQSPGMPQQHQMHQDFPPAPPQQQHSGQQQQQQQQQHSGQQQQHSGQQQQQHSGQQQQPQQHMGSWQPPPQQQHQPAMPPQGGMPHGHGGGLAEPSYPPSGSHGVQRFSSYTPPPPPPAGLVGPSSSHSYTPPPVAAASMGPGPQGASSPSYTPPMVPQQSLQAPAGVPPLPGGGAGTGMSAMSAFAPAQGGGQSSPHGGAAALQALGGAGGSITATALPPGASMGGGPLGSGVLGAPSLGTGPLTGVGPSASSGAPPPAGHGVLGCPSMGPCMGGSINASPVNPRGSLGAMQCPSMGIHANAYAALNTPSAAWRGATPIKGRQLSSAMPPPAASHAAAAWPGGALAGGQAAAYGAWMR